MKKRKLGRGVAVVGAGMSKFGNQSDKNTRELFVEAFSTMLASVDRGINPGDIEALYVGNAASELWETQTSIGVMCADWVGLTPKPAVKIEDACASSQVAIREGIMAIASGMYDIVVCGGTEKMSDLPGNETTLTIASAADTIYENSPGFTFPGLYAAMAMAHMSEFGTSLEDLMNVAIKNHKNGKLNPKAHFAFSIRDFMDIRIARARERGQPVPSWGSEMEFLKDERYNPRIAWPLRLFDCSPVTDGAACVLLAAEEIARSFTDTPIYIIGSGQASDRALHDRPTLTSLPAARLAAQQAYEMAAVAPQDIKIAEVHDCFTIAEIMAITDLGFFSPAAAVKAAGEGETALEGSKPINTSGGLKSKGHPVGASGAAMVVEIFQQMRGQAGPRQVPGMDVDLALTHNVGAHGSTCVVHIFSRR